MFLLLIIVRLGKWPQIYCFRGTFKKILPGRLRSYSRNLPCNGVLTGKNEKMSFIDSPPEVCLYLLPANLTRFPGWHNLRKGKLRQLTA